MHVFERGMHHSSVRIAKERLKSLLVSDRVQCQPDTYELLCGELYHTIGKLSSVIFMYFPIVWYNSPHKSS